MAVEEGPRPTRREAAIVAAVAATVVGGLAVESLGLRHGDAAVSAWTWGVLAWVLAGETPYQRRALVACVLLATAGELFLSDAWGLYTYRGGSLPAFVPPGHALLFRAGQALARSAPRAFAPAVVLAAAPLALGLAATGVDASAFLWFPLFALCVARGRNRDLYAVMFLLTGAMELYGTALGSWRWAPEMPIVGLSTANPPSSVGVFYCVLDVLVLATARWLERRAPAAGAPLGAPSGTLH